MSEQSEDRGLLDALDAVNALGDPWRNRVDACPGCEGRGYLIVLKAHGDYKDSRQVCFDCDGSGEGDPTEDKDIAHDE